MDCCRKPLPGTSARCALPLGHDRERHPCEPPVVSREKLDELDELAALVLLDPTKPNRADRRRGRK